MFTCYRPTSYVEAKETTASCWACFHSKLDKNPSTPPH